MFLMFLKVFLRENVYSSVWQCMSLSVTQMCVTVFMAVWRDGVCVMMSDVVRNGVWLCVQQFGVKMCVMMSDIVSDGVFDDVWRCVSWCVTVCMMVCDGVQHNAWCAFDSV